MYCPKCGTENPDGAEICRNCSRVMSVVSMASSPSGRTSALAITSLVLGLLSFCTFFLTAPLAIILGIISLIMISRSKGQLKGKGMAIAGIAVPIVALPIVAILMGILLPALAQVKARAQQTVCAANMSALGKATIIYASDYNDVFPTPAKWCDLLIEHAEVSEKEFRCPAAQDGPCNYAMNKNIEGLGVYAPPDMVLLFETSPGWNQSGGPEILTTNNHQGEGCNVLFNDCHVEFVKTEDLNNLKWTVEQKK